MKQKKFLKEKIYQLVRVIQKEDLSTQINLIFNVLLHLKEDFKDSLETTDKMATKFFLQISLFYLLFDGKGSADDSDILHASDLLMDTFYEGPTNSDKNTFKKFKGNK